MDNIGYDIACKLIDELVDKSRQVGILHQEISTLEDKLHDQKEANSNPQLTVDLLKAMADGRTIEAIKCFRNITGYGLKEAKDAVEAAFAGGAKRAMPWTQQANNP